jgi:hypothetical protein
MMVGIMVLIMILLLIEIVVIVVMKMMKMKVVMMMGRHPVSPIYKVGARKRIDFFCERGYNYQYK